jgi:hypothetical protein
MIESVVGHRWAASVPTDTCDPTIRITRWDNFWILLRLRSLSFGRSGWRDGQGGEIAKFNNCVELELAIRYAYDAFKLYCEGLYASLTNKLTDGY